MIQKNRIASIGDEMERGKLIRFKVPQQLTNGTLTTEFSELREGRLCDTYGDGWLGVLVKVMKEKKRKDGTAYCVPDDRIFNIKAEWIVDG